MASDRRYGPPWRHLVIAATAALAAGIVLWLLLRETRPDVPVLVEPGAIERFERRIADRLAADPPPTRPIATVRAEAYDIVLDGPERRPFLRAASAVGVVDLTALVRGDVEVGDLTVVRPDVVVEQRAPGAPWNYELVLARMRPDVPPDRVVTVRLRGVTVRDGRLVLRTPQETYRAAAIQARLPRVTLSHPTDPTPDVVLDRLATALTVPAVPRPLDVVAANGRFTLPDGRLDFTLGRLRADGTVLADARGVWRPGVPGLGLEARVRVERLAFADVAFLLPDLPPEGTAAFVLDVEPRPAARTWFRLSGIEATVPPSRVHGVLAVIVGGPADPFLEFADLQLDPLTLGLVQRFTGPLPYDGELRGRVLAEDGVVDFDVLASLLAPPEVPVFTVTLTGRVEWRVDDVLLRLLVADFADIPLIAFQPLVGELPVTGLISGRIELRGPPDRAPLDLDVRVALAQGVVTAAGVLDLTGPIPAYDLAGRITGVRPHELLEPDVPPVAMSADFSLAGAGVDPAAATARFVLDGRFTGWQARPDDTFRAAGRVERGLLLLDELGVRLSTLELAAAGRWRFVAPTDGQIQYTLAVASLTPWGPYLPGLPPELATGALETTGTVSGTLERPLFQGRATGLGIRYGAWALAEADVAYSIRLGPPRPDIRLQLAATGVSSPIDEFETVRLDLELREPVFALELDADRVEEGAVHVVADGRIVDGVGEALVRRFDVVLADELWRLVSPASVRWDDAGFFVERFDLHQVEDDGRLFLAGRVLPVDRAEFRLEAEALPVGPIQRLFILEPELEGELFLTADVRGPADRPRLDAVFRVEGPRLNGLELMDLSGELRYVDERLIADAAAVFDPEAVLEVDASLPVALTLGLPPGLAWREAEPIRVDVLADRVPLEALNGLMWAIAEPAGVLDIQAAVTGTPSAPILQGHVRVEDGQATITPMNQRYRDVALDVRLQGRFAIIEVARARSDGWAQAAGTILFEPLTRPELDLRLFFDRFRILGFDDRRDPATWGELAVVGAVPAVTVTGSVRVDDGELPIAEIATEPDPAVDLLAEEVLAADPIPGVPARALGAPLAPAPLLRDVVVDALAVEVGDRLWFVTDELRAQLAGSLTVFYAEPEGARIFGTLAGERGTFTLAAGPVVRRFRILESEVRFFGEAPPNPALGLTASRIVLGPDGRQVEILVRIGGTLEAPTFALTTPDAVPIPEAELLSFVLFGQPGFTLGEGVLPGIDAFETALTIGLAELATVELEDLLITDLGLPLDVFRVHPGAPGAFPFVGVPIIVFGFEVAPDVFLTVDAGLATLFGAGEAATNPWAVMLDWRIDPEWRLRSGFEPVDWARLFRGISGALPVARTERQFLIELRRRWTY